MKILHIITRLILGGAQENTVLSCAAQARAGHDVHLAFGPIYGPEGSLLSEAQASGAALHEVRSLRRAVLPVHDAVCCRSLRKLIRQVRPDVVHTHSSKAGILGRAAAWAQSVPAVVHTVHGLPFHDRQPLLLRRSYVAAERWAARRCHRLIGITRAMADAFAAERIGRPEQFVVIPSGIDVAKFEPPTEAERAAAREALGLPADAPVVGMVSRIDRLKGQDDLVEILPGLAKRHSRVRLLLVGDGWYRASIQHRVHDLGFDDHVVFTGLVPTDGVRRMLAAMDVLALPSYQEGQGRALVQAQLCERAVVGYDTGGIGEVCIDGKTGRLVPRGDRHALRDAIDRLLGDANERDRLAKAGRAHALAHFDHRLMVEQIEQVYRELLDGTAR